MGNSHKIFVKSKINQVEKTQKVRYNRAQLITSDTAKDLNTYLNFGIFPTFTDSFIPYYENGKLVDKQHPGVKPELGKVGTPGVRSIFNRAGAIIIGSADGSYNVDITKGDIANVHPWRITNNVPLMDSPQARQRIRMSSGCTVKELVEASEQGAMGQETYAYSDFMYCKHLGKVPNNHMITLRRFPLPVDDYIGSRGESIEDRVSSAPNNAACIGCMVTWMGVSGNDISNLLKYSFKMPFKEETAELQDKKNDADSNTSKLNSIFSVFDSQYQKQYMQGFAGEAANTAFGYLGVSLGAPPYKGSEYSDFRDKYKVYGPIDSIRSTYVREDSGLTFDHKISLVFEYELKAYNGINGKQAMLDLLSNILNVTYTTATFWGGGRKGFAAHQSNIFANLEIFKWKGGISNFVDSFFNDINNVGKAIGDKIKANGGIVETIKELVNNVGSMFIAGKLNQLGRPQKQQYNTLLSPAPIGFWHVTIGNPKRPIMSIGNMIITNTTIEHIGPLGIDDFPTGLRVTVELDRGKPRDLADIERLYMQGTDRIYSSMGDKVFDMYKNATLYQEHKKNNNLAAYKPVSRTATVELSPQKSSVTVTNYSSLESTMKKYFGTTDTYAIYVPAAEQEFGSAAKPKPSTSANSNVAGKDNGK